MAMTSVHSTAMKVISLHISQPKCLFASRVSLPRPRAPSSRSVLTLARHRSNAGRPGSKKNKSRSKADAGKVDDIDEDAFEALFNQLEEDLRKDEESLGDEDDISEEELVKLERELEEALAEDEDLSELLSLMADESIAVGTENDDKKEEIYDKIEVEVDEEEEEELDQEEEEADDYDEEEVEEPVTLKGWQVRRLAKALKGGRRKTSIKNLAAELCLDRAVVLELLRDPPPNLLMMSAALPDKPEPTIVTTPDSEAEPSEPSIEVIAESTEPEIKEDTPIHVLQDSWSARKRLKKAHVNTLESVYKRTKRPTNAMISSIVQVTNLPRRRVVKWFEDKRTADGVPEERRPYQRPPSQSVFSQ